MFPAFHDYFSPEMAGDDFCHSGLFTCLLLARMAAADWSKGIPTRCPLHAIGQERTACFGVVASLPAGLTQAKEHRNPMGILYFYDFCSVLLDRSTRMQ